MRDAYLDGHVGRTWGSQQTRAEMNRNEAGWCSGQLCLLATNPLVHEIGIEALAQSHAGNRGTRQSALIDELGLEGFGISTRHDGPLLHDHLR